MREIASVKIFQIEVTEDELDLYERCIKFVHKHLEPDAIEETIGAFESELLAICGDITSLLETYTNLRREE